MIQRKMFLVGLIVVAMVAGFAGCEVFGDLLIAPTEDEAAEAYLVVNFMVEVCEVEDSSDGGVTTYTISACDITEALDDIAEYLLDTDGYEWQQEFTMIESLTLIRDTDNSTNSIDAVLEGGKVKTYHSFLDFPVEWPQEVEVNDHNVTITENALGGGDLLQR